MFQKIKNIFKRAFSDENETSTTTESFESSYELVENKKDDFKQSQIEINSEPVIKRTKRAVKYRK